MDNEINNLTDENVKKKLNWSQVFIVCIMCFLVFISITSIYLNNKPVKNQRWSYRTVSYMASGNIGREGEPAFGYTSIDVTEDDLKDLGLEGWELVTSYLEVETAYPNFGRDDLVTGIQPNVRPQRLVLLFKRLI